MYSNKTAHDFICLAIKFINGYSKENATLAAAKLLEIYNQGYDQALVDSVKQYRY